MCSTERSHTSIHSLLHRCWSSIHVLMFVTDEGAIRLVHLVWKKRERANQRSPFMWVWTETEAEHKVSPTLSQLSSLTAGLAFIKPAHTKKACLWSSCFTLQPSVQLYNYIKMHILKNVSTADFREHLVFWRINHVKKNSCTWAVR